MPRVIIGSPLFNHADHVREAIESILGQTFSDFALVLVDDVSSDTTPAIAREYAERDARVSYVRNDERLGLVDNSRKAFAIAKERHPDAEYFAWTSDHDLWHPRWLQQLVEALDGSRDVLLAYPLNRRIGPTGELLKRKPWVFDTLGVTNRWTRLRSGVREMRAGNMVYGLYRVGSLERAGCIARWSCPIDCSSLSCRFTASSSRFLKSCGSAAGTVACSASSASARISFPAGVRSTRYCPWWISHAVSLLHTFTIRGTGRPHVSRAAGLSAAAQDPVVAGAVHAYERMRELRARWIVKSSSFRQRTHLMRRAIARQGVVNWVMAHLKEFGAADAWRKP